tara:strand:+ start:53 stop:487 length:435 start_codon:yes stop_codon:yes gene_type:complete
VAIVILRETALIEMCFFRYTKRERLFNHHTTESEDMTIESLESKKNRAKNIANLLHRSVRGSHKSYLIGGDILVKNIVQDLYKTIEHIEDDLCFATKKEYWYLINYKEELNRWANKILQLYTECQSEGLIKRVGEGFKPYSYVS